jgi:hypothetical protein
MQSWWIHFRVSNRTSAVLPLCAIDKISPISALSCLRSLEIVGNPFVHRAKDLEAVLASLPLLVSLELAGDARFKNLDCIKHKGLRYLFIATFEITDSPVTLAAENLPSLECLNTGVNLKQPTVVIKGMSNLRKISIMFPNADVVEIANCPLLMMIEASSYKPIGLRLSNLPCLQCLDLRKFAVNSVACELLNLPVVRFFIAPRFDQKATSWHRNIEAQNMAFS